MFETLGSNCQLLESLWFHPWYATGLASQCLFRMDPVLAVPLSFHNFWVTVLCIPVVVWAAQISYRLLIAVFLHYRLNTSRPLVLDRMSIFVDDLQQLIRQHFNRYCEFVARCLRRWFPRSSSWSIFSLRA